MTNSAAARCLPNSLRPKGAPFFELGIVGASFFRDSASMEGEGAPVCLSYGFSYITPTARLVCRPMYFSPSTPDFVSFAFLNTVPGRPSLGDTALEKHRENLGSVQ